ncbi:putative MFS-type transporter [Paraburkholderia caffeinitolerans]|uniref:Putative MFS-type transporter n=1 Tax=Paraburkholderia caffeinitolerans TaxID=1723730 RepID=A0A6J5GB63_9BURK|nr:MULTISPECIES: MFS transporter [Paraburkholderia]CAB3795829.1 putative MFS-type transporter [Paraburkholderia caffeinitolerans]
MTGTTHPTPSLRSVRALDWLNFFVANVQTGFGPFIASYLASHKWTQGEIGLALSVGTISAMVSQVPGGAAVDALRNKKAAAAWAIIAIILSAVLLASSPTVVPVMAAEVFHGFASCMLVPAMAALALALVGRQNLGDRLGRNARWASIGSAVAAGLMGLCGEYISPRAVFWLTAALALPALVALAMIEYDKHAHAPKPLKSTNNDKSAKAAAALSGEPRETIIDLLRDKRLLTFAGCVVLFHLSNAAMLNLAAGEVTAGMGDNVQLVIAACIIVPQAIVALMSPWVGRTAQHWGRRPVLILGFSALPLRALLFAAVGNPYFLVPVQMLDGISAAVFGVMLPLIAADVAGDKGRYNLCIGLFGLSAGIGATLSTALAGFVADHLGNTVSFLGLASAGAAAVLMVWFVMPETRDASEEETVGDKTA